VHGVLPVDKPPGPTSHDVVALARKALGTRLVGHAGTLDPMATGLLILAVGEATKLVRYLSDDDKTYLATVTLGSETDTLDAEGDVVAKRPVPHGLTRAAVEAATRQFVGCIRQRPPAVSAIKVDGTPLHRRVRRGEELDIPEREVTIHEIRVDDVREAEVDLRVTCGKGVYVRALARDLSLRLGTAGHLGALRRIRSGPFRIADAVPGTALRQAVDDAGARADLRRRMIPPIDACGNMERIELTEPGCENAFHGRSIPFAQIVSGNPDHGRGGPVALVNGKRQLIAVARAAEGELRVIRGFRY
jgi:tRNA pseudouridine55 synthase